MKEDVLIPPIEYLKGVGPKRAQLLQKELCIFTFEDLLFHYPFRYVDRSVIYPISKIHSFTSHIQVVGKLRNVKRVGGKRIIRVKEII